jgi:hypothetical protein
LVQTKEFRETPQRALSGCSGSVLSNQDFLDSIIQNVKEGGDEVITLYCKIIGDKNEDPKRLI